jgi:lipoprotein-anchoring transpeptidase ErfK/SrfK
MYRVSLTALASSAFVCLSIASATAQPFLLGPDDRWERERYARERYVPERYPVEQRGAPPPRYKPPRPQHGGGFLEFLFNGGQQRVYDPREDDPRAYRQQPEYRQAAVQPEQARHQVDPRYNRQVVSYQGKERPGTIIINTNDKFLYLVQDDGSAIRYGVGVGRPGFLWAGTKLVTRKREWPDWVPPKEMLQRRPDLPRHMEGGPENPLGARALYLGSSLYRIHGSNEPWTIGTNVSSGCIRMRNEDVIDLYGRVKVGTKVVVI